MNEVLIPLDQARQRHAAKPHLSVITGAELLTTPFPPRDFVLSPILPSQGLAMIYAPRGLGKTWVALSLAYAIASGGQFLSWRAPSPRGVLHVDGEMPAPSLQDRLKAIVGGAANDCPNPDQLRFLLADSQADPMPNLATPKGQELLVNALGEAEVVIFDNLSTLFQTGGENEADAWGPVQAFLLELRRSGRTVVLIHHSGKGGQQRGTSRREDILDSVIALRRPADHEASEGCRFEAHIEKCRGAAGDALAPFEARLDLTGGVAGWITKPLEGGKESQISELLDLGMSLGQIARELGMSKTAVHRAKERLRGPG